MARDRKRRRFEAASENRDKTSSKNKPSKASQRLAIQAPQLPDIGMSNSYTKQHVFQRGLARGQKPHQAAKTALAAGTHPSMRGPGSKFQQTMKALDQYRQQAKDYRQAVRKQERKDRKKNRA